MTSPPLTETCPSCGGSIAVQFCEICGERRPSERIYSLRAFFHEAFEVVTNVERSLLKTLWTLVRRPGELTAGYMRGERVPFLRPLQLFLLVSVAYFVWAGTTNTHIFNTRFRNHVQNMDWSAWATGKARAKLAESSMTERQLEQRFDEKSLVLARTLIVVMVPFFAMALAVVSINRGRPAVQHLVFSLHFFSMFLLLTMTMIYVGALIAFGIGLVAGELGWEAADATTGITMAVAAFVYLVPALRRAYGDKAWVAVIKALVLMYALIQIIQGFRIFLYWTTISQL